MAQVSQLMLFVFSRLLPRHQIALKMRDPRRAETDPDFIRQAWHTKAANLQAQAERDGLAEYRNCYNCHVGGGSEAKPGFMLGMSPKNRKQITTLRLIPTVRDSFKNQGIKMEQFDRLPNYWDTPAHNIRKRTERTRYCDACHEEKKGFLTKDQLIKDGSKANLELLYNPKPIPISE